MQTKRRASVDHAVDRIKDHAVCLVFVWSRSNLHMVYTWSTPVCPPLGSRLTYIYSSWNAREQIKPSCVSPIRKMHLKLYLQNRITIHASIWKCSNSWIDLSFHTQPSINVVLVEKPCGNINAPCICMHACRAIFSDTVLQQTIIIFTCIRTC